MNLDIQTRLRRPPALPVKSPNADNISKSLRVLVIEDDMLIGMLFADTLVGMGHTVCAIAITEEEALFAAREHMPDMMIVDVRLGRGSGIAAVDAISALSFIPHVYVTGDKLGVVELRPGAVIIEKPFRVAELAAAIKLAMMAAATPEHGKTHHKSTPGE